MAVKMISDLMKPWNYLSELVLFRLAVGIVFLCTICACVYLEREIGIYTVVVEYPVGRFGHSVMLQNFNKSENSNPSKTQDGEDSSMTESSSRMLKYVTAALSLGQEQLPEDPNIIDSNWFNADTYEVKPVTADLQNDSNDGETDNAQDDIIQETFSKVQHLLDSHVKSETFWQPDFDKDDAHVQEHVSRFKVTKQMRHVSTGLNDDASYLDKTNDMFNILGEGDTGFRAKPTNDLDIFQQAGTKRPENFHPENTGSTTKPFYKTSSSAKHLINRNNPGISGAKTNQAHFTYAGKVIALVTDGMSLNNGTNGTVLNVSSDVKNSETKTKGMSGYKRNIFQNHVNINNTKANRTVSLPTKSSGMKYSSILLNKTIPEARLKDRQVLNLNRNGYISESNPNRSVSAFDRLSTLRFSNIDMDRNVSDVKINIGISYIRENRSTSDMKTNANGNVVKIQKINSNIGLFTNRPYLKLSSVKSKQKINSLNRLGLIPINQTIVPDSKNIDEMVKSNLSQVSRTKGHNIQGKTKKSQKTDSHNDGRGDEDILLRNNSGSDQVQYDNYFTGNDRAVILQTTRAPIEENSNIVMKLRTGENKDRKGNLGREFNLSDRKSQENIGAVQGKENLHSKKYETFISKNCNKVPDVLIIGFEKCGTMTLKEYLNIHPNVFAPEEPNDRFFNPEVKKNFVSYKNKWQCTPKGMLRVEKMAIHGLPDRVHRLNKKTKLLAIVRDPVHRAISHFTHRVSLGREEEGTFTGVVEGLLDRSFPKPANKSILFSQGMYSVKLRPWLTFFDKDSIHIVDGERFVREPAKELKKVEDFLELPPFISKSNFIFNEEKGFYCIRGDEEELCMSREKGRRHPPVKEAIKRRLQNYFEPFNQEFYQMFGKNYNWGGGLE